MTLTLIGGTIHLVIHSNIYFLIDGISMWLYQSWNQGLQVWFTRNCGFTSGSLYKHTRRASSILQKQTDLPEALSKQKNQKNPHTMEVIVLT